MKKNYLLALMLGIAYSINAQVGVGTTTPDPSSELDVTSTNRGFLMPRVALTSTTDTATITGTEATSLLVYNTATVADVTPGFYYWDGTRWVTLGGASIAAWELLGNAGTNAGTNFLGTTDAQDLVIRTNNTEVLRITQPDGSSDPKIVAGNGNNHGTINDPLYTFSNDDDTGIWSDGGDEMSLGAGSREFLTIDEAAQDELIINDRGVDIDFRVESDLEPNMLFLNAADDQIFVKAATQHLGYIDPLSVYANSTGSATIGIQYAMAGWNQGNQGGGGNFVIEDATNAYAAMESSTVGVGSSTRAINSNSNGYGVYGSIPTTGSWLGYGGLFTGGLAYMNGLYNLSDQRVKKDIQHIDSALNKIMNIDGVTYKYDMTKYNKEAPEDPRTYYGFIAQNIKKELPHAVAEKLVPFENNKTRISAEENKRELLNVVDYTAVIPVLVEAMKEQQKIIEAQNKRIEALEAKLK